MGSKIRSWPFEERPKNWELEDEPDNEGSPLPGNEEGPPRKKVAKPGTSSFKDSGMDFGDIVGPGEMRGRPRSPHPSTDRTIPRAKVIKEGTEGFTPGRRMQCTSFRRCMGSKVLAIFTCPVTGRKVQLNINHWTTHEQASASSTDSVFEEHSEGQVRLIDGEKWNVPNGVDTDSAT